MPPEPKAAPDRPGLRLAGAEVKAYLKRNPDFLAENPELLAELTPPALRRGAKVVDMQRFMIDRLQAEIARVRRHQGELIAASQSDMASQSRIHTAVLSLLSARSFEHLISIVTSEFAGLLELDAVALCVEANGESGPKATRPGVHVLGRGVIDGIMGEGRDILLRAGSCGDQAIFRGRSALVRRVALIRLHINAGAPSGLLALGSGEEDKFHPDPSSIPTGGVALLGFLGRSLEHCIRAWLNPPR